jgi:neutral ceramidase
MPRAFVVERVASAVIVATGELRAGAAAVDITPGLGTTLAGYGSIRSEVATRMCGRLFATALVIDDGRGERVALVVADLHAGTRYLAELAAVRLGPSCGIGIDRLFLAATHTHSGPGHVYGNTLYDGMTAQGRGLDRQAAAEIAGGIAAAVEEAVAGLCAARIGSGVALTWGHSMNRFFL